MKRFLKRWVTFGMAISLLMALAATSSAAPPTTYVPANEAGIAKMLVQMGKLAPDADADTVDAAVQAYLGTGRKKPTDQPNPAAYQQLMAREMELAAQTNAPFKGKKLGHPGVVPNATVVPYTGTVAKDKVLMLLVDFSKAEDGLGPFYNELPEPNREVDNTSFWVPDFSQEHYQTMLYSTEPRDRSMANYYLEQSNGKYTVGGKAFGWYRVPHGETYYGYDEPGSEPGNSDNGPVPVWEVIRDLLAVIPEGEIPWDEYDENGDGYIDHLMIIHAGAGQENGGGFLGPNSIWSHSSFADYGQGGLAIPGSEVKIGPYIIMPEDGAIGVFCHEFGHNLGLPDEYDTIYSGESSPAFWSLMASGSWLGYPGGALGTSPSSISAWGRMALGWVGAGDNGTVRINRNTLLDGPVEVTLDAAELRGTNPKFLRIDLPAKQVTEATTAPFSGVKEWWSQTGNNLNNRLWRTVDLNSVQSATLRFASWWDIEDGWDYGYVEVSTDNGATWQTVPGNITTNDNPNGTNTGNGITGTSGAWVAAQFDLTPFCGQEIRLRFRYATDGAVSQKGWCIDDIEIPEIGFFDNIEQGNFGWVAEPASEAGGWMVYAGTRTLNITHYYMLELRALLGFDEGLKACYNFAWPSVPDKAQFFSYNPGVLMWYRDFQYGDNWVGVHPGSGFLLAVDAHDTPMRTPTQGYLWRTRMQARDATFGLDRTLPTVLTRAGQTKIYESLSPVPLFNDKQNYWNPVIPGSSVKTPTYGINFKVVGISPDGTSVRIAVYLDDNVK